MGEGIRQGYRFTIAANADGYTIHADPIVYGKDGMKTFYADQSMVIRENYGPEPATADSKEHPMYDNAGRPVGR